MHVVQPERLSQAIRRLQDYILSQQLVEGFWVGELEANTTLTSEYLLFRHLIGHVDTEREQKCVRYLLSQQQPDGGWSLYYGGPSDLSTTIEAYFAMRVARVTPQASAMQRARRFILARGGLTQARVFTKIFLALFGQYDWRGIPVIPPEIIFLPRSFYINVYDFSSWSRSVIVPLSIVFAQKPLYRLPAGLHVTELFVEPPGPGRYAIPIRERRFNWNTFFVLLDKLLKISERYAPQTLREAAMRRAEQWTLEHQDHTGDWGGIMPAMMNSVLALVSLGYSLRSLPVAKGLQLSSALVSRPPTPSVCRPVSHRYGIRCSPLLPWLILACRARIPMCAGRCSGWWASKCSGKGIGRSRTGVDSPGDGRLSLTTIFIRTTTTPWQC